MNARFNTNTPKEAAKALGVSEGVVVGWCRNGVINCNRVGEGTQKDRYEITDDEVHYLHTIILKFGVKDGMLRYRKDWKNMMKPATKTVKLNTPKPVEPKIDNPHVVLYPAIDPEKDYSAQEVADILRIDKTTVNGWCRNNKINFKKVQRKSGRGNSYSYVISGRELSYIQLLYKKYGSENRHNGAMAHYEKDRPGFQPKEFENSEAQKMLNNIATTNPKDLQKKAKEAIFGDDDAKLLRDIHYIRDVKARIEDCKNELALLEKEYEDLKAELVGKI